MSNMHEYIDKMGVRYRYIHVKDPETFKRNKEMYVMQDQTKAILRKIEDDDLIIKHRTFWRAVAISVLALAIAMIVVGSLGVLVQGLTITFIVSGIILMLAGLFATGECTADIWDAQKRLRNYRRDLEDIMMED